MPGGDHVTTRVPIRIPVKFLNGTWEYFYGGAVPIKDGTLGDLIVDRSSISESGFLAQIRRKSTHKILTEGTELMVALSIRPNTDLHEDLAKLLTAPNQLSGGLGTDYYETPRPDSTHFVQINIGAPTPRQTANKATCGGLWLRLEGLEPKGIFSSTVRVPKAVSPEPCDSLNHAFTTLSEVFEPWRKSHTGNIYTRMLYQEKNRKWYPLDVLRNAAIARDEHKLIQERWAELASNLTIST